MGVAALVLAAAVGVGLSSAANSVAMRAALDAKQQVPPQAVKAPNASGRFTAALLRSSNGRGKLTWSLTYRNLSSEAIQASIVLPAVRPNGEVDVLLCRRCKASSHGTVWPILKYPTAALLKRPGYVVIRTKKNPKGEIRGRIVRSG